MPDERELLTEIRDLLRRQEKRATAKPNDEMNALIRAAGRHALAERDGLAGPTDLLPTLAQIAEAESAIRAEGKEPSLRALAKRLHTTPQTILRRRRAAEKSERRNT